MRRLVTGFAGLDYHIKEKLLYLLGSGKKIILVGANYSTESRNIGEWKTEVLSVRNKTLTFS